MTTMELISRLHTLGVHLGLTPDGIQLFGLMGRLPLELRQALTEHRPALLRHFSGQDEPLDGSGMIEIRPHGLYSRSDLDKMLRPLGIDADGWIARLRPVKRFRRAWFGEDLLAAIRKAPALDRKGTQPLFEDGFEDGGEVSG